MTQAIVLGAGAAGVSTALHLQSRGWQVVLADRKGVGLETSYGNAGIIQAEAVEPYAMPRQLKTLLAIASGASNDVHYDIRSLPGHFAPLLRYWWNSAPKRHRRISAVYAGLIGAAMREHEALVKQTSARDLIRRDGFRILLRDNKAMAAAIADANRLHTEYGVRYRSMTAEELSRAEPALKTGGAGAIHWLDSSSVKDPGALIAAYGEAFTAAGGTIVEADAQSLTQTEAGGWQIDTADGAIEAGHAVVALGPWSPQLLKRFGYRIPMVRKRGYHRHYRSPKPLDLPMLDAANGYVMAPMAKGLRVTSGAELARNGAPLTPVQLDRAERAAADLVDLGAPVENQPWLGTRPCMPDMLPVIGQASRHKGLWLHFGHGHQGFTLGPATGRLLAEQMTGDNPFLDPSPFHPGRYD
jgi:D-amino-acid dehydrogenase